MSWAEISAEVEDVCADVFGDTVLYRTDANDPGRTIVAVFDEDALSGTLMEGESRNQVGVVEVSTVEPVLYVRRAALPFDPKDGHLVDIGERRYRVSDPRPDGPAAWALYLKKIVRR
ncbi:hypothetical protein [Azospirillum sp. Sh1]|uniref:head-tail joining protein n=1 Tax=Azospirillum sp. Sh1 TaxID=2607285 RepID=UPI0011ED21CE|nr:hypothetical protein [Azospirillum sp. Sh1]KAA0571078.1 hypothetical protein FZ029_27890 [Azospirillum sp. Sh1]